MKKLLFLLFIIHYSLFISSAQSWQVVGTSGFSLGAAAYVSIAIDRHGIPSVQYADSAIGTAFVMKFNGTSWQYVGTPDWYDVDGGPDEGLPIVIDSNGTPYVPYADINGNGGATVVKFNGTTWDSVGIHGFSAGHICYISLALDRNGTPYVAYCDDTYPDGNMTVMKFNGTAWQNVGSSGFFDIGGIWGTCIAIDSNGTPYVLAVDRGYGLRLSVMKFNGTAWQYVGSPGLSAGLANYMSIAIDHSGTPYVAYCDYGTPNIGTTVKKFNGTAWQLVGNASFSQGATFTNYIAIDSNGTPYVEYDDVANGHKATVMKFDGTTWQNVGNAGFTPGAVNYNSCFSLSPSGVPYVVFSDVTHSNKVTVMKFDTATGIEEPSPKGGMNLYPNPANGNIVIDYPPQLSGATLVFYNTLGKEVKRIKVSAASTSLRLNTTDLEPGVYYYTLQSGGAVVEGKKMVVVR